VGKGSLKHKTLAVGIILLFILTSVTPMVIGHTSDDVSDDEPDEKDIFLENVAFMCYDERGSNAKYEYYKEHLLNDYSNNDLETDKAVEPVDSSIVASPSGPMDSAWPMKCHDTHHTGRSPYGTADNPYDELWKFEFDGRVETSPAIGSDGIIYVGGSYGELTWYLFAIYPNGTLKWRYRTDGLIWDCCPAIAEDGTIYIGSWDDCLHAVNPDGTRKWRFDSGGAISSSPAIGQDGTIYFGTMRGFDKGDVIAVYPNGTEKWRYKTGYYILSDPAIGDDGTVYIGSSDDYLYALYPNGTLRWRYKTGDWVRGPPSIADDGTIYFGSWDHHIYALYPNGTLRWKTEYGYGSDTNPSIGLDGTIYVASASKLIAINQYNGEFLWEFNLGGNSLRSSPAICADGIIYIGIDGGEIVAVNSDGTEHWRQKISNARADSSPAIGSDGTIYICSTSFWNNDDWGHLHAFNRGELTANANGPYKGIINIPVQFTGSASGGYKPYTYFWDFGDNETSGSQNPTHEYTHGGNYTVTLTVTDDEDNISIDTTWALILEEDEPPAKPTITGPTQGSFGEPYDYNFTSIDPEEHDVFYYIDWGDGETEEWIGPYSDSEVVIVSHTWEKRGTYTISAQAKDEFGAESDWSYLKVRMPINQQTSNSLLIRFLDRFPNAFPMLRYLIGL